MHRWYFDINSQRLTKGWLRGFKGRTGIKLRHVSSGSQELPADYVLQIKRFLYLFALWLWSEPIRVLPVQEIQRRIWNFDETSVRCFAPFSVHNKVAYEQAASTTNELPGVSKVTINQKDPKKCETALLGCNAAGRRQGASCNSLPKPV